MFLQEHSYVHKCMYKRYGHHADLAIVTARRQCGSRDKLRRDWTAEGGCPHKNLGWANAAVPTCSGQLGGDAT